MDRILEKLHLFVILYAVYSGYMLYTSSQDQFERKKSRIPVMERRLDRKEKEWEQLQRYFKDIKESKKSIELVAREVEKVQQQLPTDISDTENLTLIREIAEGLNVQNILLEPLGEKNNGFYFTKRYRFKGTGTYLQFLIFFEKIAQNRRLLNVGSVELARSNNERRGRFQKINANIVIESYRYNPAHEEDRGIEEIEEKYN